tara:strand:- start:548 stop:1072 length:525 start_codon:yes stop_codon:yes gene_type:complete
MNDLTKDEIFNDGKYKVVSIKGDNVDHRKLVCETDSICILPFDTKDGNIDSTYLVSSSDYLNGDTFNSCITSDTKYNTDAQFSEVCKIITDTIGISNIDVEDLYYIGKVKHNMPFYKSYRCYAFSLDNYIDKIDESKLKDGGIDKVKFNNIVNSGSLHDSLCLSCSLLLLSYLR